MSSDTEVSRLVRITKIATMLQSKRMVTATEIAEKFDVSVRTVYRDIRALENSGIPITTVEGKGYTLMEGYSLPPLMFSEEEANALITAEYLINQARDGSLVKHFDSAMLKIKSVFRYNIKEKSEVLAGRMFRMAFGGDNYTTSHSLSELQKAITDCVRTRIAYQKPTDEAPITRVIEPLAIYYSKGNWILIAWCHLRQANRAFRIDRMQKIEFMDETFHDRKFDLQEYFAEQMDEFLSTPDTPLS